MVNTTIGKVVNKKTIYSEFIKSASDIGKTLETKVIEKDKVVEKILKGFYLEKNLSRNS